MWQLETAATKASSGSTLAGLLMGTGTTAGEAEAGTTNPPSKVHVCSREYLPLRKSGPLHFQRMVALYSDIFNARYPIRPRIVKPRRSVGCRKMDLNLQYHRRDMSAILPFYGCEPG